MSDELTIYNTSKALLECIVVALEEAAYAPLPCRICVVPGAIAWDACEGGQLVVSTVREFQAETFPLEALERGVNSSCGLPYLVAELTFSLLRCAPIPKGTSLTVPCEELEETAVLLHRDAYWMRQALSCCLRDMKIQYPSTFVLDYIVGATERVGPEGRCVGNDTTVLIGFVNG
jgi:hypothetical protein